MAMITPAGFPTSAVGTGQATLSVTPVSVGDLLIFTAFNETTVGTTVSSISGGGVTTWVKDLQATVGAYSFSIWHGVVTATGAQTITPTWSASIATDLIEYTCTAVNSGLGFQTQWRTVSSGSLHNTASTTVTFPSLKTDESALQVYFGAGVVPVNCSDGSFAGYTFYKDTNGNPTERGLNLAPNTAQQPTCVNSGSNISDTIAGLYAAYVQGFPYQTVLVPRPSPLSVSIFGPPLFTKAVSAAVSTSANAGIAAGTGAAYDVAPDWVQNLYPGVEPLLLGAVSPGRLGVPILGGPLFPQHVQANAGVATGTGQAYDATVTWQQQSLPWPEALLLRPVPAGRMLGVPALGSPLFAQQPRVPATTAAGTGAAYDATVTATEYQRPIADIAAGSWTVAPLWSKVDEVTADDADFITSETLVAPGNTSNADLRLSAAGDPLSSANQTISVRAKVTFTLGLNGGIRAELRQGNNVTSTLIGTLTTDALTTSYVAYTYTLSAGEADSITDYGDLFLRLYGNFPVGSLGGVTVSWVQFAQPAGIIPDTSVYPGATTGSGSAFDAATKVAASGGIATGSGAAGAGAGSVAGTSGNATGTGAAGAPAGADAVSAGNAVGTGAAFDATTTGTVTPTSEAPTGGFGGRRGPHQRSTQELLRQEEDEILVLI